jgi:hypothetical protein
MKTPNIVTRLRATATDERQLWRGEMMEAADEIERLRVLLEVFDAHYICEDCAELSATYLEKCQNPLHKLHEAAWEIEK